MLLPTGTAYGKDSAAEVNSVDNVLQFVLITPE
jgi:hypothetical protein